MTLSEALKIANFELRGKHFPYLVSDDKFPGSKPVKDNKHGVNPQLIIAILDDAEVGECPLRELAQKSIDQAEAANNPPPKIPVSGGLVKYWMHTAQAHSGPYTLEQLEGIAKPDTLLCRVGDKKWVKASTVMDFTETDEDLPPPPPVPDDEFEYEDDEQPAFDPEDMARKIKEQLVGTNK